MIRANVVELEFPELVTRAVDMAVKGSLQAARNADVLLLEANMQKMKPGCIDYRRALESISSIKSGKRRYNFEIAPILS